MRWTRGLLVVGAVALGFGVPARPVPPPAPGRRLGSVPLDPSLPDLLRDHLDVDGDGLVPETNSVVLCARGELRLGRSPWLPMRMRSVRSRTEFVSDIAVTWWGMPVLTGVDAYVAGHGLTRVAGRSTVGPEIDQGANLFLWSEALLVPSTFAVGTPVKATGGQDGTVSLQVPLGTGVDEAVLTFDELVPRRFSALRYQRVGGDKRWWHADYRGWHVQDGIRVPRRLEATWEGDDEPWLTLDVEAVVANVDVSERIGQVTELVRTTRARAGLAD